MQASSGRIVGAVAAGTGVLVVWGMLFWGALAGPLGMFHALPNAVDVARSLERVDAPTGTYFFPWPRDTPEAFERFEAQHKRGPFFKLSLVREGVDPSSPGKLLLGTLHHAVVALLAVALLLILGTATLRRRVLAVFVAGLIGTTYITVGDPVWFHLPWDHVRGALVYELVSWLLLGVTAAVVLGRPTR